MKNAPNLRFKEFTESWEKKRFSKYIKLYRGSSPRPIQSFLTNGEGVNWIKIGDTKDVNNYIIDKVSEKITYEGSLKSRKVEIGELILANSMSFGKTYMLGIEGCIYDGWFVLREYERYFNKSFLLQQLNSDLLQKQYKTLSTGGVVQNISSDIVYSTKLCCPSLKEQEKIASFFSLIDKKIELQTEKVEELKNYKKGIMQKIFSQELRFKDENGNEYPEWEETRLGKILKEVSEKTTIINQYEVISSTNNGLYLQKDYFNREIASKDNIGYKVLKRNQVVLSPQNLWMGNINLNTKYDIGMVSPSYKIFDIKSGFDSNYIGFILRTDRAFYEYKQASEQGASIVRRNLNMDLFYNISFKLPCKAEQYKISKFINKIDCKIEQEMKKLDSLNQYKKGLLQQMFI